MRTARITVGSYALHAVWEDERSPKTCLEIRKLLPLTGQLVHARWSGEACWIPLGDRVLGVEFERPTRTPAPGEILFYPGLASETEILIPYGDVRFSSKAGPLDGNHFLTVREGRDTLTALGRKVFLEGAQTIRID